MLNPTTLDLLLFASKMETFWLELEEGKSSRFRKAILPLLLWRDTLINNYGVYVCLLINPSFLLEEEISF